MKTCTKCNKSKPLDAYYQNPECRDGRQGSCKLCDNARSRAWRLANPESTKRINRQRFLRATYGITIEQYDALLSAQGGCCACCGSNESIGRSSTFHVDHDHVTGQVRGILCHACNIGIGSLGDTREGVAKALAYLEHSNRGVEETLASVSSTKHVRSARAPKTHCKHGHPFDEENTYVRPNGRRDCWACKKRNKAAARKMARGLTVT